jgi:hypothetical protein
MAHANANAGAGAARLRERLRREYARRVESCCLLVERRAKELISIDGTGRRGVGVTVRLRDGTTRRLRKGSLIYGANPSRPGEPPHLQTGRLRASVSHAVRDLVGRVGTNVRYGRDLELGTRRMAARPWLRRALADCRPEIRRILSAPMR